MYLNDLESFLLSENVTGIDTVSDEIEHKLNIFIKLLILLYADDTVLMSESAEDLQNQLNAFSKYCAEWRLQVNVDKTKVVIFSKGRRNKNMFFTYNNNMLEIVNEYKYLGINFSRTGSFISTKNI